MQDKEMIEQADIIIKILLQNVIRGWGLMQFEDEKGRTVLVSSLIYARAALQKDCDITEEVKRVKSEVRSFCESIQDLH